MRRGRRGGSRSLLLVLVFVRWCARKNMRSRRVRSTERETGGERAHNRARKKKGRRGRFLHRHFVFPIRCQEIRTTIRLHTKKGGGRRTVNASRRVVVESALRASLRSARAIILLLLLLSAVFQKHTLLKSLPFFSSLLRESKVPCSVFVCGRFRRRRRRRFRHQNCSCCLFCFAVKVVFKVPFVGKNAINNGGDDSDGVIQKKKTMTSYDLRQSRLVSLSRSLSFHSGVFFSVPTRENKTLSLSKEKKKRKKKTKKKHLPESTSSSSWVFYRGYISKRKSNARDHHHHHRATTTQKKRARFCRKRERERGRNREEGRHVDSSTPDDADIVPDDDDDDDEREKTDDVDGVELCFCARDKKPRNERKCRRKKKRPIYGASRFRRYRAIHRRGELEVQRHASVRQGISPNAEQKRSANREKLRRFLLSDIFALAVRERKLRLQI